MSESFAAGFALGFLICGGMWIISDSLYRNLLRMKADARNRTAEKIGQDFYYIVPEPEYIELLQRIPRGEGNSDDIRIGVKLMNAKTEREFRT